MTRMELIRHYESLFRKASYGSVRRIHKLVLNFADQLIDHGARSLLDIGCGRGHVVRELEKHGFDISGSEPCYQVLKKDLRGLSIFPYSTGELYKIGNLDYDVVFSIDVLDHLSDEEDMETLVLNSFRCARLGVFFAVNGDPVLRQTHRDSSEWVSWLESITDFDKWNVYDSISSRDQSSLIVAWFFKEE